MDTRKNLPFSTATPGVQALLGARADVEAVPTPRRRPRRPGGRPGDLGTPRPIAR